MENLTLTTPVSVTTYRVQSILLDWRASRIKIVVSDTQNDMFVCEYGGATATTLMTQLNKLDLTTNSLHKRILERLVTDGKLPPGNVTGSPD